MVDLNPVTAKIKELSILVEREFKERELKADDVMIITIRLMTLLRSAGQLTGPQKKRVVIESIEAALDTIKEQEELVTSIKELLPSIIEGLFLVYKTKAKFGSTSFGCC